MFLLYVYFIHNFKPIITQSNDPIALAKFDIYCVTESVKLPQKMIKFKIFRKQVIKNMKVIDLIMVRFKLGLGSA